METKRPSFWWLKNQPAVNGASNQIANNSEVKSSSLLNLLEKSQSTDDNDVEVDVGSLIEEINRVAAQSPLGPFEKKLGERSIDDLVREAEKIYMESSKSFEQLSQRSKTSQNLSDLSLSSKDSTTTPKSVSPLPLDQNSNEDDSDNDTYSEDFSINSKTESSISPVNDDRKETINENLCENDPPNKLMFEEGSGKRLVHNDKPIEHAKDYEDHMNKIKTNFTSLNILKDKEALEGADDERKKALPEKLLLLKDSLIKTLEEDNQKLKNEIKQMRMEHHQTIVQLDQTKKSKNPKLQDVNLELNKVLDELKDAKEHNTFLQMQLDTLTQNHSIQKHSYEDLLASHKSLEGKNSELETSLSKYKHEYMNVEKHRDKLLETETTLNRLLDIEKLQTKSMRIQTETDAKCIQDQNRQIKEMERIIARKHPDSVSALIMAAKNDSTDSNLTARKLLEDRIKTLEQEASSKEQQSSKVFVDIQEKFNLMKQKYENHIEDLELHVVDLKSQLKNRLDTFDMYTQTTSCDGCQDVPEKDSVSIYTQTDAVPIRPPKIISVKRNDRMNEPKPETHLLATIRGLQADLSNKEKVIQKTQKDLDEIRKTNRRLQKEREGSLKNIGEIKGRGVEFRSYPEKLALQNHNRASTISLNSDDVFKDIDGQLERSEFEKIKQQLYRIEQDYQNLKQKRLHDLNALQEAHEREMASYANSFTPLREQLELQQMSLATFQTQLASAREELAIVTVERDHLNRQMTAVDSLAICDKDTSGSNVELLKRKIVYLEKRYQEREHRLRAIVNGLAQKNVMNNNCEQCAQRQQQLINYKMELDQILATIRALQ